MSVNTDLNSSDITTQELKDSVEKLSDGRIDTLIKENLFKSTHGGPYGGCGECMFRSYVKLVNVYQSLLQSKSQKTTKIIKDLGNILQIKRLQDDIRSNQGIQLRITEAIDKHKKNPVSRLAPAIISRIALSLISAASIFIGLAGIVITVGVVSTQPWLIAAAAIAVVVGALVFVLQGKNDNVLSMGALEKEHKKMRNELNKQMIEFSQLTQKGKNLMEEIESQMQSKEEQLSPDDLKVKETLNSHKDLFEELGSDLQRWEKLTEVIQKAQKEEEEKAAAAAEKAQAQAAVEKAKAEAGATG